jgi:hypothetical protein
VIEPVEIMPWWAWLLIWTGLVLALVVMLGLFAWWLFRKFLTLTDDLADLAERSALLEVDDPVLVKPEIAVLAQVRDIREREAARRAHRADQRRQRDERRMARARRITGPGAAQREWPADWVS